MHLEGNELYESVSTEPLSDVDSTIERAVGLMVHGESTRNGSVQPINHKGTNRSTSQLINSIGGRRKNQSQKDDMNEDQQKDQ